MAPGGGGSADGLTEDMGSVVRSFAIVDDGTAGTVEPGDPFVPDARPGARAPHAWLSIGNTRVSTLDLFGRGLVLLCAGPGARWRQAAAEVTLACGPNLPLRVRVVGRWMRDADGTFAETYGLQEGGAVLVRPDGTVAWRCRTAPADHGRALAAAIEVTLGRGSAAGAAIETDRAAA